jgi:hypothetical protein
LVGGAGWRSDRKTLLHELEELTYIQGELAAEGILLRGGIASGLVLSDPKGNGIFGPALIDAYMLESRHAQYPRIVLHPALLELHAISRENGLGIYAEDGVLLTRASEDGFYFVDYLRNFPREVHEDPSPYREEYCRSYIVPRKQRIEEGLAQKEVLSSERTKYAWLARYHDEVAREILGEHATDVLIAGCVPR